jgi:hypothetical protein
VVQLKKIATIAALTILAGCASKSSEVSPTYVSPLLYSNYSCEQLAAEGQSVSSRAATAAGVQDKNRSSDTVATTVGVVLFWPSLFFIDGDDQKTAELANLRGQMEAIEQASIQRNCGIQFKRS